MRQRGAYKSYVVVILSIVLAFNFMDRWALGLVLQEIKIDLQLTDTQLGLLSGIAFALFYSVMGIPIARWADRGNRVTIISVTAALWSVAVALCGLAGSFAQLLLIRVGVAVGEAGGYVPAFSLLADYFNRAERPRAVALYGLGSSLSPILGYWVAGWLNELYGWRVMFIALGAPGLVLAALVWLSLREPRREIFPSSPFCAKDFSSLEGNARSTRRDTRRDDKVPEPSFREVCTTLWANSTFCNLLLCLSVMFFFIYGIMQWQPTFFIRSYGLTSGQIGTWFAVIYGVGGALGSYLGGELASRYAAQQERFQLRAIAITLVGCGCMQTGVYLSSNSNVALALLAWVGILGAAINGPLYATIQTLVPERMRAVAIALVLFFANLIGMGLGPLAAGTLSDALRPWAGEESLRFALLILAPGFVWAGWHAWRASQTVGQDIGMQTSQNGDTEVSHDGRIDQDANDQDANLQIDARLTRE